MKKKFPNNISNPIYSELLANKLIKNKNIIKISNKTRNKKMLVYQDKVSKVIFLEKYLTSKKFYKSSLYKNNDKKILNKNKKNISQIFMDKTSIISDKLKDDARRIDFLKNITKNKKVLDFGCGWGFFLNKLKNVKSRYGVEIRKECIDYISKKNKSIKLIENFDDTNLKFDVITLFHVLEHVPYQIDFLKNLYKKLDSKGYIIIEVPSANDFLLSIDSFNTFKKFTLWEEHLILHTHQSLKQFLKVAGFSNINIKFYQRYNYLNHMGWFFEKKPGMQSKYNKFYDSKFETDYNNFLVNQKMTDTLIAIARKK